MAKPVTLSVSKIRCEGCATNIRKHLGRVEGVTAVDVDVAQQLVKVTVDAPAPDVDGMVRVLSTAGFSASLATP
jgi:copper chaperone